jgi:hypothetical protein
MLAALTALTAAPPAAARHAAPARQSVMTAPRPAGDPIMAIVSIKSQHVTFYDADGWILRAPVSTGTTGRETPAGVFAVIEKDKDHHSSMYDDAWMPNMLRITWNGIALHGGPLPGYAASHGCVRMPFDFAEKVFDKAPLGMRVIISPNDTEPVAFSDPALFVPKQDVIDAMPARAQALAHDADDAAKTAAAAKAAVAPAKRAAATAPGRCAISPISGNARMPSSPTPRRCSPPPASTPPRWTKPWRIRPRPIKPKPIWPMRTKLRPTKPRPTKLRPTRPKRTRPRPQRRTCSRRLPPKQKIWPISSTPPRLI